VILTAKSHNTRELHTQSVSGQRSIYAIETAIGKFFSGQHDTFVIGSRLFQAYGLRNLPGDHRDPRPDHACDLASNPIVERELSDRWFALQRRDENCDKVGRIIFRPSFVHCPLSGCDRALPFPLPFWIKWVSNVLRRIYSPDLPLPTCLHRFIIIPPPLHHPSNNCRPNSSSPSSKTSILPRFGYSAAASHEHGKPSSRLALLGATNTTLKR